MSPVYLPRVLAVAVLSFLLTLPLHASSRAKSFALPLASERSGPSVVVDALPDLSLAVTAFSQDGTTVTVETRRGLAIPDERRAADPSLPPFEMDIRFLDSDGFPFLTILGGHAPIEASWDVPSYGDESEITAERAASQYAVAAGLIAAVDGSDFALSPETADWKPERDLLVKVAAPAVEDASMIRHFDDVDIAREPRLRVRSNAAVITSNSSATNVYRWTVQVHKKGAFFENNVYGDHSATVTRSLSKAGVVQQTRVTSNHGAAANTMSAWCSSASTSTNMPKSLPASAECATGYGFTSGKHVCNDDTYIQYITIRDKMSVDPTRGTCADSTLRRYAPCF